MLITIKDFSSKHEITEANLRAIISALQISPIKKKDDVTKTRGVKPQLYSEDTLLKAIIYVKAFQV